MILLASVLLCLASPQSRAQVNVDPRALDQLRPPSDETPAQKPPAQRPGQRGNANAPRGGRNAPQPASRPAPQQPAADSQSVVYGPPRPPASPAPQVVPPAAPPAPVIPPPIFVPTRPVPPPTPVPIVQDAPGEAITIKDGLRVTFGTGRADLNQQTDAAVRTLVHSLPPFDTTVFTLTSTAAAQEDDPSTPRRLALARAIAIRSVLITEGVSSPRITVKVVGAPAGGPEVDVPADRVDIVAISAKPGAPVAPSPGASKP